MLFRRKPEAEFHPEWMIVGLGNPGAEYKLTRHNLGFEVVELLASRNRIRMDRGRNRALVGFGKVGNAEVLLVKPLTYVNLSGQAVAPLARKYQLKPEHVLVVADELDLPLGKLRLKQRGSAGGHNGHKSIIASLHSQEYPRIKIGIEKVSKFETIDHVLSRFDREEREVIDGAVEAAADVSELVVSGGLERALNRVAEYNHAG